MLILAAYFALYLNTTICYKWGNSFVSPDKRGAFSAVKEMISLIAGVFFTLGAGAVIDKFENSGNLHGGFKFLAVTMVFICGCNLVCLLKMKEKPLAESGASQSVREIVNCTFKNRNFRNTMILTSLTEIARYMTIGFMGTYKTIDLGLSVSKIQIINIASCLGRFVISKPIGKYSDEKGFSNGYFLGNVLNFAAFVIGIFASVKHGWLIVPFTILLQMSYAGTYQNTFNMAYCYVDEEHIMSAFAVNNSIRGTLSFLASFVGSFILDYVQKSGNTVWGLNVNGQQVLCVVSALIALASLIFNKKVVSKQEEIKR